VAWSLEPVPDEAPSHLLGIGDVDDLLAGVAAGIDIFDCATPTRLGRHGTALVSDPDNRWRLDLTKSAWRESRGPIAGDCPCPAKTTVCRLLARHFPRAAHVEADAVQAMIVSGGVAPGDEPREESDRQLRARARACGFIARELLGIGVVPVVDDVVVGPNRL